MNISFTNRLPATILLWLVALLSGQCIAAEESGAANSLDIASQYQPEDAATANLETQLKAIDSDVLAEQIRLRGNPQRGAIAFFTSAAGCVKCHGQGDAANSLGPDLATIGPDTTDKHLIEALLLPSRSIRKGYETVTLLLFDGRVFSGVVSRESDDQLVLRDSKNMENEITIAVDDIEARRTSKQSMMPTGLVATLQAIPQFLDLASYVFEVAHGGAARAAELHPTAEQLVIPDDTKDLNHAGILNSFNKGDIASGRKIYFGLCVNCHGKDGNTPSLPTARAFGTQKLKFGADPYNMFMTLSRGNGLMAATTHLSPKERYQVVHFIREEFMRDSNPDYQPIDQAYLEKLPKGSGQGKFTPAGERDYGLALASQFDRDITSVLSMKLGATSAAYDLHTLDQVDVWRGGFLNLKSTQHQRARGEGIPQPEGTLMPRLNGWAWGHHGSLDYPNTDLLPRGPLPKNWLDYHGYYIHGDQIILSYAIDGREILEVPEEIPQHIGIRHTLQVESGTSLVLAAGTGAMHHPVPPGKSMQGVILAGADRPDGKSGPATGTIAISGHVAGAFTAARVWGDTENLSWQVDEQQRLVLKIPEDAESRTIEIATFSGETSADFRKFKQLTSVSRQPRQLLDGGPSRWPKTLSTVGYLGFEKGAYAVDTITIPESTPWNTWFRTSSINFLQDGRMVVATLGGEIWIVSGIDKDLLDIQWKRFAAGLYEPLGMQVVDGLIYVCCKDRIVRLHDLNGDDEADFYESFSADTDVSSFFHAFNFGLERDSAGNFYYAKSGQYTDYELPGSVIRVSPDGTTREVVCTGFRTPNGIGMFPNDRLTVSDNQGNWMPASKINLVKQGGFYGYVQTHSAGQRWAPDGGRIDHTKVVPPDTFDQPMIWMPQHVDNSSGGQIWVDDPRWGPLSGRMLHTSFGKGWLYSLMPQEVAGVTQAALVKLPHHFNTGIMRGRVNPTDGQVYVTGLDGWNSGGRPGLKDKGIQRVRYTGKPHRMVSDCQVLTDGLRVNFNFVIDPTVASDRSSYEIHRWNYSWQPQYGSEMYQPRTGKVGTELVNIAGAKSASDQRSVDLLIPDLRPVHQLHLKLSIRDQEGEPFEEDIYWTIHNIPRKISAAKEQAKKK
ncbi:Cytochrome c [Planctomycetes bacterium CA13]|uniref:Cytochrome c n=1 Tax=Novipirellula herctigrandis TaxID=2527986 RepID=A0A5C5YYW5_9BACT|nr:Cytochrome c [Planctomycetes bacterium CA13]